MRAINAYVLVDANIARSVSIDIRHPQALKCKQVADVLADRDCATGVAMTPQLYTEWRKHATALMSRWLVMIENKGRLLKRPDKRVAELRHALDEVSDAGIRAALMKDLHLSEAAIIYGFGVLSLDDRQRRYLAVLGKQGYGLAGAVFWANPLRHEDWEPWLRSGCSPSYDLRCLPG